MNREKTIDLRLLAYFHKSAELGSITKAAEALHVTQPTLSKAIRLLEHQLGAEVFLRNAHGVEVTDIGDRLRLHAGTVMSQISYALEEIEALNSGNLGRVRVGAGPSWIRQILPEAIARISEERPSLTFTVHGGFDERLLELLYDGQVDFVVAEKPLEVTSSDLEFGLLSRGELVVCARQEHPLAQQRNIDIEAVLKETWALPPSHSLAHRKLDGRLISLGFSPIVASVISSSQTLILNFIRHRDALTYTTRSKLNHPESTGLVEIDVPDLISTREAGIICRKPRLLTPAAEYLVQTLKELCIDAPDI